MYNRVVVGMAEYWVSSNPEDVLCILGLGSCVGLCLYDPRKKIGGMVHISFLRAFQVRVILLNLLIPQFLLCGKKLKAKVLRQRIFLPRFQEEQKCFRERTLFLILEEEMLRQLKQNFGN